MSQVRIAAFTLSLDGYGAGPDQSLESPLGRDGEALHGWMVGTKTFQAMIGQQGGSAGIDDDFVARSFENVGAYILGRNMFGPVRGPWPDESWKGWWGENPPYHTPVFVLTHHPRPSVEMEGGTVFHFVTEGVEAALARAQAAAGARDVRIGGGVATARQYLETGLVDEMHLAVSPVLLGRGEALFPGLDLAALGFRVAEHVRSDAATHLILTR